mgnify:CR=1 FL=1
MNILITGACGFIGFNFCLNLLKNKKSNNIIGIDNLNNYYSVKLKLERLKILKTYKNFTFKKIDISNNKKIYNLFKKNKFNVVYNFAAQASVRYSLLNPKLYIKSNIVGFFNILEASKEFKPKKIIYASSSSIYGENKNFPLSETEILKPKNIYSFTKKNNEEMAEIYSKNYNLNLIGLRFFTIYGEWGRPDMMILKYIEASLNKKIFYLNNYGNHTRDFTYIKDVINIMNKLFSLKTKKNHEIFNICSNKPIKLNKIIQSLNVLTNIPKIKKIKFQKADVLKTHGSNKKITRLLKIKKFTNIDEGLSNTFYWYKKFLKKIKI